jgi:hypothetical protein
MGKLKTVGKSVLGMGQSFFSLDQIVKKTGIPRREVCHILEKFYLENIIKKVSIKKREEYQERRGRPCYDIIYRLIKKQTLYKRIAQRLGNGTEEDRMWQVLRYLKIFTRRDLIVVAEVSYEHAIWFTKMLHREGIIWPLRNGGPKVKWRLVEDVGPKRPCISLLSRKGKAETSFKRSSK